MTKWVIRAVNVDGSKIQEYEAESDSPANALTKYACWIVNNHGFYLHELINIDIDRVED